MIPALPPGTLLRLARGPALAAYGLAPGADPADQWDTDRGPDATHAAHGADLVDTVTGRVARSARNP